MNKKIALYITGGLVSVLAIAGGLYGYLYATSPEHIRHPKFEHYHFRTQVIVNDQAVDFSQAKFQQPITNTGSCSVAINGTPIDFHDNIDQMTHIHWKGITGGEFLKYYGWNFIGGSDNSMGQRFDQGFMNMPHVPTFGKQLPDMPPPASFYVYIGDENDYQQKDWNDFLKQDLEDFFGKQSNVVQDEQAFNLGELLSTKVQAHGGADDGHVEDQGTQAGPGRTQEELTRINNLIGNVVIFVQSAEPTTDEIKARFSNLLPLQDSTCGG